MTKLQIISLVLASFLLRVLADANYTNVSEPRTDLLSQTSEKPQEESSFMSKIASWIFPFGSTTDPVSGPIPIEANRRYAPEYLPPQQSQPLCNPCNQEPWVPMASRQGHNTVINFVQPNSHGPPAPQYGPPRPHPHSQYGVPNDQHGYHSNIRPNVRPPPNNYMPPTYFIPPPTHKPKHPYKFFNHYKPPIKHSNPQKYLQNKFKVHPSVPHHGPPIPLNFAKAPDHSHYPIEATQGLALEFRPPSVEPEIFKSYAPILTNYDIPLQLPHLDALSSTLQNYQHTFSDHSTRVNNPQYPELSYTQSLPVHGSQSFNYHAQNANQESVQSVQLMPSIRIADFVSSIEYPVNVIQSPIVEVIATSNDIPKEDAGGQVQQPKAVDDVHTAATAQNATYFNLVQNHNGDGLLNEPVQSLSDNSNTGFVYNPSTELPNPIQTQELNYFDPTFQNFQQPYQSSDVNLHTPWNVEAQAQFASEALPHSPLPNEDYRQYHNGASTEDPNFTAFLQKPAGTEKPLEDAATKIVQPFENSNLVSTVTNYRNWPADLSTAMVPPPINPPVWQTTKKPKHVQIIIPYKLNDVKADASVLLPLYTQPPAVNKSPVWANYALDHAPEASKQVAVTAHNPTESVLNINDFVTKNGQRSTIAQDIFRLQKNIDGWTEQEFANTIAHLHKSSSTSGKLIPSKIIPTEYLTTHPYSVIENSTGKNTLDAFYDHDSSDSNRVTNIENSKNLDSNLIITGTTPASSTLTTAATESSTNTNIASMVPILSTPPNWEKMQLSISPQTKEKIYVVTPQPWKFIIPKEINDKLFAANETASGVLSSKLSVVIKGDGKNPTTLDQNGLKLIYSEWPHLINKLMTTTTEEPKITNHPLFGLMDLTSISARSNSTIETYGGHSKVVTGVTPTSTTEKKITSTST